MSKNNKKEAPVAKAKGKAGKVSEEDAKKAAKKAERLAKLKERPEGQRPNSKQIDIIEAGKGTVEVFAAPVRKFGCIVTAISIDEKGNATGVSITAIAGFKPKSKKGHGQLVMGIPGIKKVKGEQEDEDED